MNIDKRFRLRAPAFARFLVFSLALPLGLALIFASGCSSKQDVPADAGTSEAKEVEIDAAAFAQTEPGARATFKFNGVEFALRYCPAGSYTMGSPASEAGRRDVEEQRDVTISDGFWICETETTQEQWDAVGVEREETIEDSFDKFNRGNEKEEEKGAHFKGPKLPVEMVFLSECQDFAKKLNELGAAPEGWSFDLPTEEQWEYACRAGTTGADYGVPTADAAWFVDNSGKKTHDVGTKEPNKWGIYDMLGNVWEWTKPQFKDGKRTIVDRGGSFGAQAAACRPAFRHMATLMLAQYSLGFRCALVPSASVSSAGLEQAP